MKIALMVVVFASSSAFACSCIADGADVMTRWKRAKDRAEAVFIGRVLSNVPTGEKGRFITTLEVLETFKGSAKGRVKMPSSSYGSDCSFGFRDDGKYLIYASTEGALFTTSSCTRSRFLFADDAEVRWLRSGTPVPKPVSLQRERVACEPCEVATFAQRISGVRNESKALVSKGAFWSGTVGRTKKGQAFLLKSSSVGGTGDCRRRVTRFDCSELKPPTMFGVECVRPTEPVVLCDENSTRQATLLAVEPVREGQCTWDFYERYVCDLGPEVMPGDAGTPMLHCSPSENRYVCSLKAP